MLVIHLYHNPNNSPLLPSQTTPRSSTQYPKNPTNPKPTPTISETPKEENSPPPQIPSEPKNISIPKLNIDQKILEYTDQMVEERNGVNPLKLNDIVWWSGGGKPGTDQSNTDPNANKIDYTTFIYGHSTNNDSKKIIFDDIDLLSVGDEIFIDTEAGNFSYLVVDSFVVKKDDLVSNPTANQDEEGRLVLISCWSEKAGTGSTNENVVVISNLTSFTPANETKETP